MYKKAVIALALLLSVVPLAMSQEADTARSEWHLSAGSSVAAGFGSVQSLSWVAPSVVHRASDRLTVSGGLAAAGSLLDGYELRGREPHSLAPRRQGTRLGGLWAKADYRVGEHMWLWASLLHVGGYMQPLWLSRALPVGVTAVSGGLGYEFANGSLLEMHFHFVHDHYGTTQAGLLAHPYYGMLAPTWELYGGPWPF